MISHTHKEAMSLLILLVFCLPAGFVGRVILLIPGLRRFWAGRGVAVICPSMVFPFRVPILVMIAKI